ncbi:MAG: hypothetical protein JOS17DRAFT_687411, partial [Linnemannia elongata]
IVATTAIGANDDVTGQCIHAFVCLKPGISSHSNGLTKEMTVQVRIVIGPFAAPEKIYLVESLPKTRSRKLMRRILRKTVAGGKDLVGRYFDIGGP